MSLTWQPMLASGYDLGAVKDIGAFQGSDAARELLAKNGFVVADPAFNRERGPVSVFGARFHWEF